MLVLIRGLPGSGKTTMAKSLRGFSHWEADMFMLNDEGGYEFDHARLSKCHELCLRNASEDMAHDENVVVANVFHKVSHMLPYMITAEALGHEILVIEARGEFKNLHGCPKDKIERLKKYWEEF